MRYFNYPDARVGIARGDEEPAPEYVGSPGTSEFQMCAWCGALVGNQAAHDEFHERSGEVYKYHSPVGIVVENAWP